MARQLGVGLTTVYNRVRRLKKVGVIKKAIAQLDHKKLGYGIRALVGVSVSPQAKETVAEEFEKFSQVHLIYQLTGRYDYLLEVLVRDTDELRWLLVEKMGKISNIQKTETMLVTDVK